MAVACSSETSGEGPIPEGGSDGTLLPGDDGGPTEAGPQHDGGDAGAMLDAPADHTMSDVADEVAEAAPDVVADVATDVGAADGGDAGPDATDAAPDVQTCSGVLCQGSCLAANDCSGCSGATLLCPGSRVCLASCSSCTDSSDASLPVECYSCDVNRQNPIGTCTSNDSATYCLSGDYSGGYADGGIGYHCPCSVDGGASTCPGDTQVCAATAGVAHICVTCGEVYLSDLTGQPCKNGNTCAPASASCQ